MSSSQAVPDYSQQKCFAAQPSSMKEWPITLIIPADLLWHFTSHYDKTYSKLLEILIRITLVNNYVVNDRSQYIRENKKLLLFIIIMIIGIYNSLLLLFILIIDYYYCLLFIIIIHQKITLLDHRSKKRKKNRWQDVSSYFMSNNRVFSQN